MTDRGRGRGVGRGINRGRGRGRGRSTTIGPPPSTSQPTPSIREPPHSTTQPTHPSTFQTPTAPHNQPTPSPKIASTSQQPSVPHNTQSTSSPHISLTQTPNMAETPPAHASVDATGSPAVGSSSSLDPCSQIGSMDSDGRMWIRPGPQNTFDPPIQPTREISRIIKGKFEGSWESYGQVKTTNPNVTKMWFEEFERKFKWLVHHDEQIRKIFDHKASEALSNAMYRVRRGVDVGSWIPRQKRVELDQKWNDDNWKEKARTNANNRNSSDGSLHTGGSIPTSEHFKRLKISADMTPTCWDLFQKTHKTANGDKWVSSKAERIANEYQRRLSERESHQSSGDGASSSVQSENSIFYDVVGGLNKKGRIFGLGSKAGKYKASSSGSYDGISNSEYEQMKNLVSNLSEENRTLKEQLQSHSEMIRASQEESRLVREQLRQFMETFSPGLASQHLHPPQPSPTHDQDDPQSNDNELDDDHDVDWHGLYGTVLAKLTRSPEIRRKLPASASASAWGDEIGLHETLSNVTLSFPHST
ncbi:hypothetical protein Fmac_032479 [Flemingia macrophylla]|uniref:Transposase, Ptta/En/Spm, plant n=1 Tax=Flemingia macrophylla TaxID=520843 RepID=A0ABD1L5F7_9FABA